MTRTEELFDLSHTIAKDFFIEGEGPHLALPKIKEKIIELGKKSGFPEVKKGVFIAEDAIVAENATIIAPTIIGRRTEVRPGAYIRGCAIIGDGVVIGNSTEIKNAIIFDGAQLPHYNYVGDSIIGYRSHLGAGAIASNFRLDHKSVPVNDKDGRYDSGLRKLGTLLGDGAEVGCNSVLCPGTVIGRGAIIYPLSRVIGYVGEGEKFIG